MRSVPLIRPTCGEYYGRTQQCSRAEVPAAAWEKRTVTRRADSDGPARNGGGDIDLSAFGSFETTMQSKDAYRVPCRKEAVCDKSVLRSLCVSDLVSNAKCYPASEPRYHR